MSEKRAKEKRKNQDFPITPPTCPGCGLDPSKSKELGFKVGFLALPIPNMGLAHFVCPRCFCVMMNKECFENQAKIIVANKPEDKSRIITNPKSNILSLH